MFFQIKAIRKGSKPPIWRRAWIPSNITFTQLALILEIILEYPESAQYEFEFFQKKDRIIEWQDEDEGIHDYYYSYLNAPDTFVNDWLLNENWFTFRLKGQKDAEYPDYRVEIEKAFDKIRDKNRDSEEIVLNSPMLVKETSPKNDRFWTRQKEIVPILEKAYGFREAEPEYLYLEELRQSIAAGQGLAVCADPVSRDIHTQKSSRAILKEIGDKVWDPVISPRLEALKKELGYDETTNTFQASEDETEEAIAKLMEEMVPEMHKAIRQAAADTLHNSQKSGPAKAIFLEDLLKSYTKQDLLEIADEFDLSLKDARKDTMAYQLTRQLLEPQNMRELLLELSEEELDTFEAAMEKGRFFPSESEEWNLASVHDMVYIAAYTNGYYQVPEDVIHVYNILKRTGYRELHKKCHWLLNCLHTFALIHVVAPERILCRMYQQNKSMKADSEEMISLMEQIPDRLNPCRRIGGKIVVKGAVNDRVYEELERQQRNTTYYIPTESEINSIAEKGFPESEKAYRDLAAFYKKELRLDDEETEYLCNRAFVEFCAGGMLSDYSEYLDEEEIEFKNERQVRRFADLMMQVNNNTRMYILKGHTPNEMASKRPKVGPSGPASIVPMSSMAAQMLEESRDQLAAMGVNVDTDSTADILPAIQFPNTPGGKPVVSQKKIYPNDPCPCGSGKKYKKCCGRNK